MYQVPIVYSVFNRAEFIEKNLSLFRKLNYNNITFLVDSAPYIDLENLRSIKLVKKFCEETGAKIVRLFNYGSYCVFTNYYSNPNLDLSHYHALVEDDFILSEEFLKFHNLIYENYNDFYEKYGAIVPFGFNIGGSDFKLIEIDPSLIDGCLWGAGYNNKYYLPLYRDRLFKNYKIDYLDSIILKYFEDTNKKILVTSHNLLTYCGFKDSRDKERLITCLDHPELFEINLTYKDLTLNIDNSLVNMYLEKFKFFQNDCKECI